MSTAPTEVRRVAATYVRLRWRLLRGALRHGGSEQVGAVLSTGASAVVGLGLGITAATVGRSSDDADLFIVVFCGVVMLGVLGFGIVAGISQPIDPRVVAAEPLSERERVAGLLAASALGPPGLAGAATGVGMVVGMVRGVSTVPVVLLAVASWLVAMLLIARTATNLLALVISRFPRFGQIAVGLAGLVFYGLFQFVPGLIGGLEPAQRERLADAIAWTPPGQVGRALATADEGAWQPLRHLIVGSVWLVVLVVAFVWSSERLAMTARRAGGLDANVLERSAIARAVRRACGRGSVGAIAWRSILVRFRTPRTALEAVTGAGVGLGAVLVPTLARDAVGSGAVLVGGAVQLAVLFMSGNSFGSDGPALTHELLTGIEPRELVTGKVRGIVIVAAPLAVIGPLLAAAITGEWRYLAAGFGVGIGGLLAGAGAAIVQSALVPIAVPESDNPFASGETGKGMLAAILLAAVLSVLAVVTVPVALALLWAVDRGDTTLVTVLGAITIAVGWGVSRVGVRIATTRITGREPEFAAAVTPAR